jgi:formate dehydrogenase subunit delta
LNPQRLVDMANDIAANLSANPDHAAAVETMVVHLQRFWEPVMRQAIVRHLHSGGEGLDPLARDAVAALALRLGDAPPPTARGASDAG